MHPSISPAERALRTVAAGLENSLAALSTLRRAIPGRLPLADAEAQMDDTETHLDTLARKLADALKPITTALDRIDEAEEIAFAREHGLLALAAANDNGDDDGGLAALKVALAGGVL